MNSEDEGKHTGNGIERDLAVLSSATDEDDADGGIDDISRLGGPGDSVRLADGDLLHRGRGVDGVEVGVLGHDGGDEAKDGGDGRETHCCSLRVGVTYIVLDVDLLLVLLSLLR